jgi:hypothetical protein
MDEGEKCSLGRTRAVIYSQGAGRDEDEETRKDENQRY